MYRIKKFPYTVKIIYIFRLLVHIFCTHIRNKIRPVKHNNLTFGHIVLKNALKSKYKVFLAYCRSWYKCTGAEAYKLYDVPKNFLNYSKTNKYRKFTF
jgi:hypothetical protein